MKTFELVKEPLAEKAPTQAADDDLVGSGEVEQGRVRPADGDQRHLAGRSQGGTSTALAADWMSSVTASGCETIAT
jgi:hypothetical protein